MSMQESSWTSFKAFIGKQGVGQEQRARQEDKRGELTAKSVASFQKSVAGARLGWASAEPGMVQRAKSERKDLHAMGRHLAIVTGDSGES